MMMANRNSFLKHQQLLDFFTFIISILTMTSLLVGEVSCNADWRRLEDHLLHNYSKLTFPKETAQDSPIEVNVSVGFRTLVDVEESEQTITINLWQRLIWYDYYLQWDPDDFGNITQISIMADMIWFPDIYLYDEIEVKFVDRENFYAHVSYDGRVWLPFKVIYTSTCTFNIKSFPFDEQECTLQFGSWSFSGLYIDIYPITPGVEDISMFQKHSEWELTNLTNYRQVDTYNCCSENPLGNTYPTVIFTLHLRRKPLYYVFNLMLPSVMVTLVALFGFFAPNQTTEDQSEKVTLGLTTLLAMAILLMTVSDKMPATSDNVPHIGTFYGSLMTVIALATAFSAISLSLQHRGVSLTPVPDWLATLTFDHLAKFLGVSTARLGRPCSRNSRQYDVTNSPASRCTKIDKYKVSDEAEGAQSPERRKGKGVEYSSNSVPKPDVTHDTTPKTNHELLLATILSKLDKIEDKIADEDSREYVKVEWMVVARVFNRLLHIISVIAVCVIILSFFLSVPIDRVFSN